MPRFRTNLPQIAGNLFLTDGGLETTLVFHEGIDLPEFAAFVLLDDNNGREILKKYYRQYATIAREYKTGFVLESMTWRASEEWGTKIGYTSEQLSEFNRKGIQLLEEIREEFDREISSLVISGCMGPRGDGYRAEQLMSADEAEVYHRTQIKTFKETETDMVTAFTIPYASEAIGLTRAAKNEGIPVAIGFTVETDGRLPSGENLGEAIEAVDAATDNAPVYYMINCAHPAHFLPVLHNEQWTDRIQAVRSNASRKSHTELDNATEIDTGNIDDLGAHYLELKHRLKNLNILGGCCGTDHRHIKEICRVFISNP
jgi:S-methylmethionine-dependent homocysteine/selenocysteine methylase